MSDVPRNRLGEIFDYLEAEDYIEACGEYSVYVLLPKADEFIKSKNRLVMRVSESSEQAIPAKKPVFDDSSELLEKLRKVRRNLAAVLGVPPYVIFSDATLRDMTAKLPRTHDEFLDVSGVGTMKAEKYGKTFLGAIKEYVNSHSEN